MITISGNTSGDLTFTADGEEDLPREMALYQEWPSYQKQVPTKAYRMKGPFTVETSEGPLTCADGYLCLDARGYPYPVAADEFDLIYGPAAPPTIVGLLRQAQERLDGERSQAMAAGPEGIDRAREFALAITKIQEAVMWAQRGMARKHDMFNEIDVEAIALGKAEDTRVVKS